MQDDHKKTVRVSFSAGKVAHPGRGKPQFKLMAGPGAPQVFNLEPGEHTLGRSSTCDIQIRHESLSRRHMKVVVSADGEVTAIDLESRNGVFCNNISVESAILRDGDSLQLGSINILFRASR